MFRTLNQLHSSRSVSRDFQNIAAFYTIGFLVFSFHLTPPPKICIIAKMKKTKIPKIIAHTSVAAKAASKVSQILLIFGSKLFRFIVPSFFWITFLHFQHTYHEWLKTFYSFLYHVDTHQCLNKKSVRSI